MTDIFPPESDIMRRIEEHSRAVFKVFGYGEIRTPLLEETALFTRSIGGSTDIVEKEMYSFKDRSNRDVSLRPEGTASVIRAVIENGKYNSTDILKLFYLGAMFRGERPQKGRLRQFHQIGAEILGSKSPYVDAELIFSLYLLLKGLGITNFTILINSLGCGKDRIVYKKELGEYLAKKRDSLCEDCQRRVETNVLRVLDCKKEKCAQVVKNSPNILSYLCGTCENGYTSFKNILSDLNIPFKETRDMVRGLDYYTGIIFEVVHPDLGGQDAVAAGGRYDNLAEQMGGHDTPATGYAVGIERLALILKEKEILPDSQGILVIPIDEKNYAEVFKTASRFWEAGISCEVDHTGRSFKGQMRMAHRDKKGFVVLIGDEEVKKRELILKDMKTGSQESLTIENAKNKLRKHFNTGCFREDTSS
ncbi:MAG: histidine--tRNA ligase [Candidatus Omnitrophota bacterium]